MNEYLEIGLNRAGRAFQLPCDAVAVQFLGAVAMVSPDGSLLMIGALSLIRAISSKRNRR